MILDIFSEWHPSDQESSLIGGQNQSGFVFFLLWFSALLSDVFMPLSSPQKGSLLCSSPAYLFSFALPLVLLCIQSILFALLVWSFSLSWTFVLTVCPLRAITPLFACLFGGHYLMKSLCIVSDYTIIQNVSMMLLYYLSLLIIGLKAS